MIGKSTLESQLAILRASKGSSTLARSYTASLPWWAPGESISKELPCGPSPGWWVTDSSHLPEGPPLSYFSNASILEAANSNCNTECIDLDHETMRTPKASLSSNKSFRKRFRVFATVLHIQTKSISKFTRGFIDNHIASQIRLQIPGIVKRI